MPTFHFMQTAKICKAEGAAEVGTFSTDLTSAAARETLISDINNAHGHIDVLVRHHSRKIDVIVATSTPSKPLCLSWSPLQPNTSRNCIALLLRHGMCDISFMMSVYMHG